MTVDNKTVLLDVKQGWRHARVLAFLYRSMLSV